MCLLASQGTLPRNTVILWISDKKIPTGWQICDGSNGTPDLRNRFMVGAGDQYNKGDTGGANEVILTEEEESTHYHTFGFHNNDNSGYFLSTANQFIFGNINLDRPVYPAKWNGSHGGSYWSWDGGTTFGEGQNLVTSGAISVAAKKPHENRPPYFAVPFICHTQK